MALAWREAPEEQWIRLFPNDQSTSPRSHRMTPLRQRMIEDMQLRNLSTGTQRAYLHYIPGLARFYQTSPEHLSLEELREYQLYMINERQYSPESVNHFVCPLNSCTTSLWRRPGRKAFFRDAVF